MKNIDIYINENINEDLSEWLKKVWEWIKGKFGKDEYDPTSAHYNEAEKIKYIKQHTSKAVNIQDIKNAKMLDKILDSYSNEDESIERGFKNVEEYLAKFENKKEITNNNKWYQFIFESDDLEEVCGLVGIGFEEKELEGKPVVYIIEFLNVYKSVINYGSVIKSIKNKLNKSIFITTCKSFARNIEKEELEIEEFKTENNKTYWQI